MQTQQQRSQFFSQQNKSILQNFLHSDYEKRNGVPLTEQFADRMDRTLDHYMGEVYSAQPNAPVAFLNKEVLTVTVQDFTAFLRRQKTAVAPVKKPVATVATTVPSAGAGTLLADLMNLPAAPSAAPDALMLDTNKLFDRVQKERNFGDGRPQPPPVPDFRINLDENSPPALELYEMARKAREQEAVRASTTVPPPPPAFVSPTDNYTVSPSIQTHSKVQQLDTVIRQDDIIKYKEVENNLIIYSADRDWTKATAENRYNFTVNFNPANNGHGFGTNITAQHKFKNITRIEFVKAILPAEGIDIVRARASGATYETSFNINVLNLPFVRLHIDELDGNNYGTSNELDNAFGVIQYDAQWHSDQTNKANRGYTALVSKYMKCERKYSPTPLATLNKLTINLQRPEGGIISSIPDTVDIAGIYASADVSSGSIYYDSSAATSAYYFINTSRFFNNFTAQKGDRMLFKGVTISGSVSSATYATKAEFQNFITRDTGHLVVGVAYGSSRTTLIDGYNSMGYANYIIIAGQYKDPTTGLTTIQEFGGSTTQHAALGTDLQGISTGGRGLNLNHQIQLVFRVITREMDASTTVRPDNL